MEIEPANHNSHLLRVIGWAVLALVLVVLALVVE